MKLEKIISIIVSFFILSWMISSVNAGGVEFTEKKVNIVQEDRVTIPEISMSEMEANKKNAKEKIGKKFSQVDLYFDKFDGRIKDKITTEQKAKYEFLYSKINPTLDKIDISNLTEAKKQAYRDIFEYIRTVLIEKIALLEKSE